MNLTTILNETERNIEFHEPTNIFAGVYNVSAHYGGSLEKLDKKGLTAHLRKEGLEYSKINHGVQMGFNDVNAMGTKEAKEAQKEGKSNVWIGLCNSVINLEITPKTWKGLKKETHVQYATRILNSVLTYVETESNYSK